MGVSPDLDHLNEDLRSHLKDWLMHLKEDVGYSGWRFDFVKGYGPEFVKEYVLETVGGETFNVGEYWVDLRRAASSDLLAFVSMTSLYSVDTRQWCWLVECLSLSS